MKIQHRSQTQSLRSHQLPELSSAPCLYNLQQFIIPVGTASNNGGE